MAQSILADGYGSDVAGALSDGLAGPLVAGARTDDLDIAADGSVMLERGLWEPLALIAPSRNLQEERWRVTVTVDGVAGPSLQFAPWMEQGAYLPAHRPLVGEGRILPTAVTIILGLTIDGTDVPAGQVRDHVRAQVLCGSVGRLLYVLQAETPRIRRVIRQIANARTLEGAQGTMLDRIGRELAVPRFADAIGFQNDEIVTKEQPELDAEYRRRLRLYRPFLMPTRRKIGEMLNGTADRPGPLQQLGAPRGFGVLEEDNRFSIALKVVSSAENLAAATRQRQNYLRYLRDTLLIDPTRNVPGKRRLPSVQRVEEGAMRRRLRQFLQFASTSRSVAPALAQALDRAALVVDSLELDLKLNVVQAQQDEGGSRFELGLAVEVEALAAAKIDELRQAIDAADAAKIDHSVARSVIAGLKGTDKAASDGGWFWSACGVRTAHPLSASRVLLSHFSTQGMVISGPSDLAHSNAGTEYTVQLLAAHDQQTNAALAHALSGGSEGWDTGDPPWTVIAEVDQATAIPGLNLPPEAMADRLRALGLPSAFDIARFKQSLPNLPPAMFAMLNLTTAFANGLNGGLAAAWDRLSALLEKLSLSGVASVVLVHHADGRTILVISAIRLPFLGASMSPRRSSGFVWRALPITSGNFSVKGAGTRGLLEGGKGLASIAVVGYARTGLTDPFEYRVTAPEGAALDLPQYEFLMNILRQVTPAGVQVNTWELRRSHVALDPAKPPMPLPPKFARAFRPFQRPRFRDVQAEPITEPQRP